MKPQLNILHIMADSRKQMASLLGTDGKRLSSAAFATSKDGAVSCDESVGASARSVALFKKIVESVVKANKKALANKDEAAPLDPQAMLLALQSAQDGAGNIDALGLLGISPSTMSVDGTTTEADQNASEILKTALSVISKTLNLNVPDGLQLVNLNNASDAVKDQLAEILSALKGMNGLLNGAIQANQPMTISGKYLDTSQTVSIERVLRVETFAVEMALKSSGLSGDIAQRMAQKNDLPASNIITATDPSLIATVPSQVKQALGNGISAQEQSVETLFKKLAYSLQENAPAQEKNVLLGKISAIATSPVVNEQTGVASAQETSGKNIKGAQLGTVDAKVLRTLLKIDATGAENNDAAQGTAKLNLPDSLKTLIAKDLGAAAAQNDEKAALAMADASGMKNPDASTMLHEVRNLTTNKTTEESVMNQISDKLQTAVKTGVTEIRLLLRPESLGEMRVKLTLDGDMVMGKIYVENQQVKHIIETNMQSLKDSLANHNLQVGTFDVNVGGGARDNAQDMTQQAFAAMNGNSKNEAAFHDESTEMDLTSGLETGRRYGSNTVEFFA
jgi:flagellar hook-length control protein FliK